jgi:outer membrane biosynthesis protein TonB
MQNLLVEQKNQTGTLRTWRLKPESEFLSVGSSKHAKLQLPSVVDGIEGFFRYQEGVWNFQNLNLSSELSGQEGIIKFATPGILKIKGIELHVTPIPGKDVLFESFANVENFQPSKDRIAYNLFLVHREKLLLETEVELAKNKFLSKVSRFKLEASQGPFHDWQTAVVDGMTVTYRTLYLKSLDDIKKTPSKELIDEDGKKALYGTLAFSTLVGLMMLLTPNTDNGLDDVLTQLPTAPVVEMKLDKKPDKKTAQNEPKKPDPKPAGAAANRQPSSKAFQGSSSVIKSLATGRISQLIGKVSIGATRSKNIVIATGVPAGSQPTGRALAAIGAINKSGKDWASEGKGTGVAISTKGKAGGVGLGSYGKLATGNTGAGGVGLIEEESEVVGGLDREVIANYIRSKLGQILYCYERQLSAQPDLYGKVAVKFTIGPTGGVEAQKISETTLANNNVENCILQKLADWKFPAPKGGTRVMVTYPFLFKSTR